MAVERWTPTQAQIAVLESNADAQWRRIFVDGKPRARTDWGSLASFALGGLAANYRPERVAAAIEALAALQDTNAASPTYGNVHWYVGDDKLVDRNGVEFMTRHLSIAWLLFADRLTPEQRGPLRKLLDLARIGVARHQVSISYTNIFLMKAWNLIALGQMFEDADASAQGSRMLRDWLERVRAAGIEEYLSTGYYAVDIENLGLIENLARDGTARDLARQGLDIVWSELARHWYAPGLRLGGPHSRTYDRLYGRGDVYGFVARAGWLGDMKSRALLDPYRTLAYAAPSAEAAAWLSAPLPRFERGMAGAQRRYASYHGKTLYIGTADASYGYEDSPLTAILGAGFEMPTISFTMDGRRDFYGRDRIVEAGSGHPKSLHLRPTIASVQAGTQALLLGAARNARAEDNSMSSTLILPADAEFWLGGRKLEIFNAASRWRADPVAERDRTAIDIVADGGRTELRIVDHSNAAGIGVMRLLPAAPGDRFVISAELAGGPVALYLNFLDAGGRVIGAENIRGVRPDTARFSRFDFAATAPDGTVQVKAWLYSAIANRTELRVRDLAVDRTPESGAAGRVAEFDFAPHRADDIAVPTGSTLTVRREGAALAIRPLGVWGADATPVAFRLINDGLIFGAVRLTAIQAETRVAGQGVAALWLMGGEDVASDAAFAAFRTTADAVQTRVTRDGEHVGLEASGGQAPLGFVYDLARNSYVSRTGVPEQLDGTIVIDGKKLER
ncbi:MAG: hypothetical protein JNJ97_10970 [Alphaproteobacteria bacterium]|nr:hypothetical protein [Alphaproteobacteria bacterium]